MYKREILMEYTTQDIIAFLVKDKKIDFTEAMRLFYLSETYEKLLDEETGLYLESSPYVYDLFKDEYTYGKLIQAEL